MKRNIKQLGYVEKNEISEINKKTKDFVKENEEKRLSLDEITAEIDQIQNDVNSKAEFSKQKMAEVNRKVVEYVELLKSKGESEIFLEESVDDIDITELEQTNTPRLLKFLEQKKPVEEQVYKNDIIDIKKNYVLHRNSVLSTKFHENASLTSFAEIPYDNSGNWEKEMSKNKDKIIKIRKNFNTKSFEFGIKYTQTFTNVDPDLIKIERYFVGKITLTGLNYHDDVKSIDSRNDIPFSVKGVIYNADYDKTDMFGPKLMFKIVTDDDYIYLWLDSVQPYRFIPVMLDSATNLRLLDLKDINTVKEIKTTSLIGSSNYYIDYATKQKLDTNNKIGVSYNVNFSLYDTTFSNNVDDVENSLSIIDYCEIENIKDTGEFEVKPPKAGYAQMIGYNLSNSLNATLQSPLNLEKEFRNYTLIDDSHKPINELRMSSNVHYFSDERFLNQIMKRPEAFRRCGVISWDDDRDYFYAWVEEDIQYGFSKSDSTTHTLTGKNSDYVNFQSMNGAMPFPAGGFGKYKGKRCLFYIRFYGDANHTWGGDSREFWLTFIHRDHYRNKSQLNKFEVLKFTLPSPWGFKHQMPTEFMKYDEYTGYWYMELINNKNNTTHTFFRTKDFVDYENIPIENWLPASDSYVTGTNHNYNQIVFSTDNNGRFIFFRMAANRRYTKYVVFDNGNFSSPVYEGKIYTSNSNGWDGHNAVICVGNGTWIFGDRSQVGRALEARTPVAVSDDNGISWRMSPLQLDTHPYPLATDNKGEILQVSCQSPRKMQSIYESRRELMPYFEITSGISTYLYHFGQPNQWIPQDRERNNAYLKQFILRGDGYFGEWEAEDDRRWTQTDWLNNSDNKRSNFHWLREWRTFPNAGNGQDPGSGYCYHRIWEDIVNDNYAIQAGNKHGIAVFYPKHLNHWFIVNRIYKVSKLDYSMLLIENLNVSGKFTMYSDSNVAPWVNSGTATMSFGAAGEHEAISNTHGWYRGEQNHLKNQYVRMGYHNGRMFYEGNSSIGSSFAAFNNSNYTYWSKYLFPIKGGYIGSIGGGDDPGVIVKLDSNFTNKKVFLVYKPGAKRENRTIKYINPNPCINGRADTHYARVYGCRIVGDYLYFFSCDGVHRILTSKINFENNYSVTDQNTYNDLDLETVEYPWYQELRDDIAAGKNNTPRLIDDFNSFCNHQQISHFYDEVENKIIIVLGDGGLNAYHRTDHWEKMYNSSMVYDGKYEKGFLVVDCNTFTITPVCHAFKEPGDYMDIDYFDTNNLQPYDIDTLWGRDAEGLYIVSPKTGNMYSVYDGWTRFEKRKQKYPITQVLFNKFRNSYVVFPGSTPTEYAKNNFVKPQIRELQLNRVNHNITQDDIDKIKKEVIGELDKRSLLIKGSVLFKLEIVTKCYESQWEKYLMFYETGTYDINNSENQIIRYFVPDISIKGNEIEESVDYNGRNIYERNDPRVQKFGKNNTRTIDTRYTNDFDLFKGYHMKHIIDQAKIPGIDKLKWSEKINKPLENLENSLLKMPTKIKLTIYPTSAKFTDVSYNIHRRYFNSEYPRYTYDIKTDN